ncbi:MAG: ribonuclease R [Oscillospiraceae bacterium]|nr:ribonuclease R [Oscillospiraceae bacterium]
MSIRSNILAAAAKRPVRLRDLVTRGVDEKKILWELSALVKEGKLVHKVGTYYLPTHPAVAGLEEELIRCTIVKLGRTFGFAMREDLSGDLFIPGRSLKGAMPGDKVLVRKFERPRVAGSEEGEVVRITEQCNNFVGTLCREEDTGRFYLEADACPAVRLYVKRSGAQPGDKVAVSILARGERHEDHRVEVTMSFGAADEAKHCAQAILFAHGLDKDFPDEVKAEAAQWDDAAIDPADVKGRLDLRDAPIFTIDSASTKDIDDAISIARTETGFELGVHIADVSHYVTAGSALDKEAYDRGTSVYYADQVIPMLPKQLSNGICSLNPQVERLAFSCMMELDEQGEVVDYSFEKSVILSRVKGVYSELNAMYEGTADEAVKAKYEEAGVMESLPLLKELYDLRIAARKARGGMEIESGESKLVLDENGVCVDVHRAERGLTEAIIEECMLLANQCAAHKGRTAKVPFVYRTHEAPDEEKQERLKKILVACNLNAKFAGEAPTQHELAALLDASRGTPVERCVHTSILRSMGKAKYEPVPKGHFGLALSDYAHFTSPIRRYPDLAIHRVLTDLCAGEDAAKLRKTYESFAAGASEQASNRELAALQVERGAEDCYKAEFMKGKLGEVFEGVVSGVAPHGIYVELPSTVEGLVHISNLCEGQPDLLEGMRISDPLTGASWSLGDTARVKVAKCDVALGKIDFVLAGDEE